MTQKFKTIITDAGVKKLAAGLPPDGKKVIFTAMAVGDGGGGGGGTLPEPKPEQAALVREVFRALINTITPHPKYANCVVIEMIIPPDRGGFWMRELGLYDSEGVLIAVANVAESYKPLLEEGSGRASTMRMVIAVSNIASVELQVDSSTVMATKEYVDDAIDEHAKSRNHPDATLKEKGFVQLSSATDSDSETLAATPKAVKAAVIVGNAANQNAEKRLLKDSNLADVPDKVAARRSLGLGSAAQFDASAFLNPWNNLWDVQDKNAARLNLGLGSAATRPDTAFLATGNNLWDVPDKNAARTNLGLKSAALLDAQTSKNDLTPGRVLVNGSAVAVMDAVARASGGSVTDANNLPSNNVGFVYSDAQNSPGFESSLLDFTGLGGGYNVQLAASYARPGLVKLRTKNGDVKTWSKWTTLYTSDNPPTAQATGAVPAAGGDVGYLNNAAHYAIKPGAWEGAGAFANQLGDPRAPFVIPMMTAPAGKSTYYPMIKSSMQTQGLGYQLASSLGVLVNGNATFPSIAIHGITDAGTGAYWIFDPNNGSFNSSGAIYEAGRRVYSPLNPPPKQDLSGYMVRDWATVAGFVSNNADAPYIRHAESDAVVQLAPRSWVNNQLAVRDNNINARATYDWVNSQLAVRDNNINARATPEWVNQRISDVQNWTIQNFIQSEDLTAPFEVQFDGEWGWAKATDGAHVYNLNMVGGDRNRGVLVFRYKRYYKNGGWIVLN